MSRFAVTDDVIFLGIGGSKKDVDTEQTRAKLLSLANSAILSQWTYFKKPLSIRIVMPVEWLITDDVAEVQAFELGHDCDSCREGKAKAVSQLTENPNITIAVANLRYVEEWPE